MGGSYRISLSPVGQCLDVHEGWGQNRIENFLINSVLIER